MKRLKISFTTALFAVSAVMAVVVAFLLLHTPRHLDDAAVSRISGPGKPVENDGSGMPAPEFLASGRGFAATPVATQQRTGRSRRQVEADMDPADRRQGADMVADGEDEGQQDELSPSLAALGGRVISGNAAAASEHKGLLIERGGVHSVRKGNMPPVSDRDDHGVAVPGPDYNAGSVPPPALAEGLTPTPAPARVAPRHTLPPPRPTRLPMVTNFGVEESATDVPPSEIPSDAGQYAAGTSNIIAPLGNSPQDIAKRFQGRVMTPAPRATPAFSPLPLRESAIDLPMSTPAQSGLPAEPTPIAQVLSPAPSVSSGGVMSNSVPGEPSPTPQSVVGEPMQIPGSKYTLPPAPTLPPRKIRPDSDVPSLSGGNSGAALPAEERPFGDVSLTEPAESPADDHTPLVDDADLARINRELPPELAKKFTRVAGNVAASVGDKRLTETDARKQAEAMVRLSGKTADEDTLISLTNTAAQEWAERTAIAEEARRQGINVTDKEVSKYIEEIKKKQGQNLEQALKEAGFTEDEVLEEMRASALGDKLIETTFQKQFTEDRLKSVFDANPEQFTPSRRLHVMEIFKARPKDAKQARAVAKEMQSAQRQVARGEDFSKIAVKLSEAPSAQKGGDMGWLDDTSVITPQMASALVQLQPGSVSDVIESPAGFQILKLIEVDDPRQGFQNARKEVEKQLRELIREKVLLSAQEKTVVKVGTRVLGSRGRKAPTKRTAGSSASGVSRPSGLAGVGTSAEPPDDFGKPISPASARALKASDFR